MGDRPVGADGERPRAGHGSREGLGGSGAEEVFAAGKGGLVYARWGLQRRMQER